MALADLIAQNSILPALKANSKKQVLQELAAKAAEVTGLSEREIFDVILQRERLGSTGVGNGVAIPHGKLTSINKIIGVFARLNSKGRLTEKDVDDGFRLPLTQSDVADLLGLTNVYVSKTIARIERDRLIRRQGNRVMLLDLARLREACEYNRPTKIDTSWFPEVRT